MSGCAGWSTVERGLVLLGKVLSWFGEVLFCCVGRCGALYGLALHGLALLRFGNVKWGLVSRGLARLLQSLLSLRLAVVRYSKARSALALLRRGQVWLGTVLSCKAWCSQVLFWLGHVLRCPVRFGSVMPGLVMRCIVRHSSVGSSYGNVRLQK